MPAFFLVVGLTTAKAIQIIFVGFSSLIDLVSSCFVYYGLVDVAMATTPRWSFSTSSKHYGQTNGGGIISYAYIPSQLVLGYQAILLIALAPGDILQSDTNLFSLLSPEDIQMAVYEAAGMSNLPWEAFRMEVKVD